MSFKEQFEQHIDASKADGMQMLNQFNRKDPNGFVDALEMFERLDNWTQDFLLEHKDVLKQGREGSRVMSNVYQRTFIETLQGYMKGHPNTSVIFEVDSSLYEDRVEVLIRILYLNLFTRKKLHMVYTLKEVP